MASSSSTSSSKCDSGSEGGARRKVLRPASDPAPAACNEEPAGPSLASSSSVPEPVPQLLLPNRPPPRDAERKFSFPERGFQSGQPQRNGAPVEQFQEEYSDSSDDDVQDDDNDDDVDDVVDDQIGAIGGAGNELVQARNPYPAGRGRNDERPVFLDHRPRQEVALLVSARTNGATPMVVACQNGHLDVVEYLVERCDADIEQPGSVTFDGETIEGAPPLWVAAAAGHAHIVRYLVRRGASVNCTTKTNSTPLRAACFDGHFDIVKYLIEHNADVEVANRHGHTCLMIACYKGHLKIARYLIELGADVNRKSVKGNTALHDCAESGSLEILQLLLASGAKMDVDSYGMTPLLAAAVSGHTHIVDYIVKSLDSVSRKEKVDALELLGATYVDRKRDMLGALEYWKQAMLLRYEPGSCPLPKPQGQSPIAAFENTLEAATLEQLEEAVSDPDEMRMQALLVRERILGPAHPETSYYIRYRGAVYADTGNFSRCIRLWMYALEMQQSMLEPLSPMTNSSLLSFAELFSYMMAERDTDSRNNNNNHNNQEARAPGSQRQPQLQLRGRYVVGPPQGSPPVPPLAFADVMAVLSRAVREVRAGSALLAKTASAERDLTYFHRTLGVIVHLIFLLAKIQHQLAPLQEHALKKALYDLVKLNARSKNGYTLLHLACTRESATINRYPICSFPSTDVIRLLLDVGADPDATDQDGNTALHVLAGNISGQQPVPIEAIRLVLERGVHLDQVNGHGQTFGDVIAPVRPAHEIANPLHFTTLKCLCAQVIRKHRVPFGCQVPATLHSFIMRH